MESGETGVEPGIAHQGRKAIHALQQGFAVGSSAHHGRILRRPAQACLLQGCCQGCGRKFGPAAVAGHGVASIHCLEPGKALHEALINGLLPAPEPFAGSPCERPPEGNGPRPAANCTAIAEKLQSPGLGAPGLQPW